MRVMIVDDHTLFADAIAIQLEDVGMEVVGRATNGADALGEALRTDPDVILMDLALPDQSGLSAGRAILEERPATRLVVVTALEDRSIADEALRLGFRGYLTKDTPVARFVEAIASVCQGEIVLPQRLRTVARRQGGDADVALLASLLTTREREVLALLVEGADGGTIAGRLGISRNTVRTHVQSILTKLQVHSRLEAATFAVRHRLVPVQGDRSSYVGVGGSRLMRTS
jgi:two-component system nitrate/nitrite response regulator NarL